MIKTSDLTIYIPKLTLYLTILFIIGVNVFVLVSTKNFFNYFNEFKEINTSEILVASAINEKDTKRIFDTLESMSVYNSLYSQSSHIYKQYKDLFYIRFNESELNRLIEQGK